jgi:hypothetical protein
MKIRLALFMETPEIARVKSGDPEEWSFSGVINSGGEQRCGEEEPGDSTLVFLL